MRNSVSATYPDWLIEAMPYVKALCPADAEPTLTDDDYAQCIAQRIFRPYALGAPDDDPPRVDVFGAVHDAWMLKAGKVSGDYQFFEGGARDFPQQVYEHCLA